MFSPEFFTGKKRWNVSVTMGFVAAAVFLFATNQLRLIRSGFGGMQIDVVDGTRVLHAWPNIELVLSFQHLLLGFFAAFVSLVITFKKQSAR